MLTLVKNAIKSGRNRLSKECGDCLNTNFIE